MKINKSKKININMSLNIFSAKVSHHKNGIWWFTKMMARAVGEDRWEAMRLFRRV